jgi:hypothetical protein
MFTRLHNLTGFCSAMIGIVALFLWCGSVRRQNIAMFDRVAGSLTFINSYHGTLTVATYSPWPCDPKVTWPYLPRPVQLGDFHPVSRTLATGREFPGVRFYKDAVWFVVATDSREPLLEDQLQLMMNWPAPFPPPITPPITETFFALEYSVIAVPFGGLGACWALMPRLTAYRPKRRVRHPA